LKIGIEDCYGSLLRKSDTVEIGQTYLALYEDVSRLYCRRRHYIAITALSSTWKVLGC